MIAYQDPAHPSYHGRKTVRCYGCGCKCAKSAWGNWCHPCNVKRLDQISATLDSMAEKARFSKAVREAVAFNDVMFEKLLNERNAILCASVVDDMHGLYLFVSEAYEAGRRAGHEEMYAATSGMSFVSAKHEASGDVAAFRAAEECCKIRQDARTTVRAPKTV